MYNAYPKYHPLFKIQLASQVTSPQIVGWTTMVIKAPTGHYLNVMCITHKAFVQV